MKNLSLRNIEKATNGRYIGDTSLLDAEVANVVIDNRKVEKDFLFVAIDGENVNAHKFIPDAIASGAIAVVSHEDLGETDFPYIFVENTGQALLDIAKLYRNSLDIKVVGISGSVGKTSTKEMIASVLKEKYRVHKTIANFNNEWGLPITIFDMPEDTEVAILEMGVNHFGEMRRLSRVTSPDICIVTNIGTAHIEFFGSKEGIMKEKLEMIMDMKDGGTILLNGDDELLSTVNEYNGNTTHFFGSKHEFETWVSDIKPLGLSGTDCILHFANGENIAINVNTPGLHMVANAVAAASVGFTMGLTKEEIKRGIESLPGIPGRNNIIHTDKFTILDDCYNANPASMKAALDVLSMSKGRKVAILGNMGELGDISDISHNEVAKYAVDKNVDLFIAIGNPAYILKEGETDTTTLVYFESKDDFYNEMNSLLKKDDNILVKASHGAHFEPIVEKLK